ncbi:hypothetical protein CONLIGDRAFT_578698, partial [Coniochaeta ligniaria NRRL 30616]
MRGGHIKHLSAHLEEIALGAVAFHADVDSEHGTAATDTDEDKGGDDDEDHDNRKYCLCQMVSSGNMCTCDNDECQIRRFHWSCVGLESEPTRPWYCPTCQ